ncbi:MAG TPA: polysaccharide biosynthesis/export family protein [Verrucomicrobiae bacterium]
MKLFVWRFFAVAALLASLLLTGCASSSLNDPVFSDNPGSPAMAGSPGGQDLTSVARFHVGETVSVVFSESPDTIPPHEESIKEDGNITLPYIGTVHAVGKTAGELQNEIHDLYVPKYYVRLTVTVKPGDLVYYVTGEVNSRGRQIYLGETTVTKAITSAQSLTDFANHKKVWLIRANGQRIKVNYDKALEDPSKDLQIYPGDQIQVERKIF